MWAVSVRRDADIVGVVLVGHPARVWMADNAILSVLRVAVKDGNPNACSMLYGAASRMARAAGADGLVTYTLGHEPGTSLRAAGWLDGGMTKGGEHSRPSRQRDPAVDAGPKRRWWAPWSKRAKDGRVWAEEP